MFGSTCPTDGRDHAPTPQHRDIGPPMTVPGAITELADLEARFRAPSVRARTKVFDRIDASSAHFIDLCPFLVLAIVALSCGNRTALSSAPDLADTYTCQFGGIDAREMRLTIDEICDRDLTTD
jgi:hypothetical protein